jgi:flagellar basal-body rod protein FlgC
MNIFDSIRMSATGMSAERVRLNVASMNLANAHVTRTIDGGPYRARSVVFHAIPYEREDDATWAGSKEQMSPFDLELEKATSTVKVAEIVEDSDPFKEVYDPNHPDADERGIVKLPNVNVMEQMVDIMTASRAYEANVTAIETAKTMALKAIGIAA